MMVDGLAPAPHSPEESSISDHPLLFFLKPMVYFLKLRENAENKEKLGLF
ncbi:hypothetical protein ATR1_002d0092 [Acetobacter tropicalis]|uniref:Uncharacterized protein n=1 Tax=Acetobacter tropicalis TaxID=104102 RepID=A0A511FQA5_9PROT|nr:hypothetical protein ATR1_002d0092 [Acetobacter tropicalis]GEL51133.1 hypothetical protein ATR01nite_22080 [Acetobacter tropicalis]